MHYHPCFAVCSLTLERTLNKSETMTPTKLSLHKSRPSHARLGCSHLRPWPKYIRSSTSICCKLYIPNTLHGYCLLQPVRPHMPHAELQRYKSKAPCWQIVLCVLPCLWFVPRHFSDPSFNGHWGMAAKQLCATGCCFFSASDFKTYRSLGVLNVQCKCWGQIQHWTVCTVCPVQPLLGLN